MDNEMDDPEECYRRGYTHGAWDVIKAVENKLSAVDRAELHRWFEQDARGWRLKHMRGEDVGIPRGHHGNTPPREKLRIFGVR